MPTDKPRVKLGALLATIPDDGLREHLIQAANEYADRAEPQKRRNGWRAEGRNPGREQAGRGALMVGQTDTPNPDLDPFTAATDAVTNICHYLGARGHSDDEIRGLLLAVVEDHYPAEKGGNE